MGGGASKRRAEEEAEARRRAEARRAEERWRAEERRRAEEQRRLMQAYRVATLQGHTWQVNAVASYTTQAGAVRVVSGSDDKTIKIWDPTRSGSSPRCKGTPVV